MKNIYLDQNVLGFIAEGRLSIKPKEPVRLIFSNEHLKEIARGDRTEILDVLRNLKAQRLWIKLDSSQRITDDWVIDKYIDPEQVYFEHQESESNAVIKPDAVTGIIATLFGSQDRSVIKDYPNEIAKTVGSSLRGIPWLDDAVVKGLEELLKNTGDETVRLLSDYQPLEMRRKALGFNKGQASQFSNSDNPLRDLWKHANAHFPAAITAEQFYGFDCMYKENFGYEKWPIFLGVATCYNLLNAIGFRPDKGLADSSRVPANISDAYHVAYAALCHGLVSADTKMCEKAMAIFKYRKIGCGVVNISEKLKAKR